MQRSHRRLAVVLILAGLQAAACAQQQPDLSSTRIEDGVDTPSQRKPSNIERVQGTDRSSMTLSAKATERLDSKTVPMRDEPSTIPGQGKPATVEPVQGTDLKRVILSAKAAERLDIKTAPVRDEQLGPRKRLVGGEVVARPAEAAADGSHVWVRVALSPGDLRTVAPDHPARVVPLAREVEGKAGTAARAIKGDNNAQEPALHYAVDGGGHGLAPGQRVRVELALSGGGTRKVVPNAAVLYDAKGKTWVYTTPEPLVFVRHPITVDYVQGDLAVLSDGPAPGTVVVTVGASELFGTELGIGK